MADQPLPLQLGERGEWLRDRALRSARGRAHDAQIDDVERVEPEVAQIVVNRLRQLVRAQRRDPRRVRARAARRPW